MKPVVLFIFIAPFCLFTYNASAAPAQSQLEAIAQAENEGKAQEIQQEEAWREERRQHIEARRNKRAQVAAAAAARENQRVAAENARRDKRDAERAADKERDQKYEDQLRSIELENHRLELQAKSARVKRENEFVDQDLKERAAVTDAIQSGADARRNLSTGGKELMQSEGKAREKEAGSWW